ncbi:EMC6-like membrane protein [Halorhabdus rudnickae]|uniref:EMC6-like membrane protein n=1 Tax=Halorhabdus rudnickae TaxID=1775544 RepID=UPI001083DCB9|nr:hypothetical protein [Halorhabdus rudnickae]
MATETTRQLTGHLKSVVVTGLTTVLGMGAGIASSVLELDPSSRTALGVLAAAILVQFPILQVVGVDIDEFSTKDYLYIGFMTFSLWFVTWSILLTTAPA